MIQSTGARGRLVQNYRSLPWRLYPYITFNIAPLRLSIIPIQAIIYRSAAGGR